MDGGSTDETPAILERRKAELRCYSSPDNGAADNVKSANLRCLSGERVLSASAF
jgi:glycosyltransferase involved in cell wall biosynthesis